MVNELKYVGLLRNVPDIYRSYLVAGVTQTGVFVSCVVFFFFPVCWFPSIQSRIPLSLSLPPCDNDRRLFYASTDFIMDEG